MISAVSTFDIAPSASGVAPAPGEGRQPITLPMRLGHRLSSLAEIEPRLLRNPVPLVSFTFDDVPDSAVSMGAAILESFGARGTFFVSTGLLGRRTPDWQMADERGVRDLAARGHEVALHTHAHQPLAGMRRSAFRDDLDACAAALRTLVATPPTRNFAYPFGFAHPAHRACLKAGLRSSRTTHPGLNVGRTDLHFLKSWAFGTCLDKPAALDRLLDEAVATGGWLILTGHDVAERPSAYGCTPALLAHALAGAAARNIVVAPVEQALDLCGIER